MIDDQQCCQVCCFPAEMGFFNTVVAGCFSCPRIEATPVTGYTANGMQIFSGEPCQKTCILSPERDFLPGEPPRNAIGLVLYRIWAVLVKTWQPWVPDYQPFHLKLSSSSKNPPQRNKPSRNTGQVSPRATRASPGYR